ncbi:MAG: DHHA1 domain-containing protein, partial [Pseudomonadota bacterium]|nr:DHHA1 domain-containing protein [Pseudomonadota bacterium]
KLKSQLAASQSTDLIGEAIEVAGMKLLVKQVDGIDGKTLRDLVEQLKDKIGSGVVLLATVEDSNVRLVAGVTKNCTDRLSAGTLVNFVAQQVGGKGGGRPDIAQGAGQNAQTLTPALESVK